MAYRGQISRSLSVSRHHYAHDRSVGNMARQRYFRESLLMDESEIICIVHVLFNRASYQLSNWIIITLAMERLLSVALPHRVNGMCIPRLATFLILILAVALFCFNVHAFCGVRRVQDGNTYCRYASEYVQSFHENTWKWFEMLIEFAAPIVIILVSNIIMLICKLIKRSRIAYRKRI